MGRWLVRSLVGGCCALAVTVAVPAAGAGDPETRGLQATYFDDEDFTGASVTRVDPSIDFAWPAGTSPADGVAPHTFSVRWTGSIIPRHTERYTLSTRSDDGVRVWIDGELVIENWTEHSTRTDSGHVELEAGRAHAIKVEFFEHRGRAEMRLRWQSASQPLEVVPASQLRPPAVSEPAPPPAPAPGPQPVPTTEAPPPPPPAPTSAPAPVVEPPAELPPAELPPAAPPVAGETFNAEPLRGEVLVRGTDGRLGRLTRAASLPVGARLDARRGAVRVDTAKGRGVKHRKQYARFSGATFAVTQRAGGDRAVEIDLTHGEFEDCAAATRAVPPSRSRRKAARSAAARKAGKPVRQLWGRGKGRFKTRGRGAVATIRGTFWTVQDTCDATVVSVREGVVDVEDTVLKKSVTVSAGESYTAWLRP